MKTTALFKALGLFLVLALLIPGVRRSSAADRVQVGVATIAIPADPGINIKDADKFLNDLKLSPYWSVTKDWDGFFSARARAIMPLSAYNREDGGIGYTDVPGGSFVFEMMGDPKPALPAKAAIGNAHLHNEKSYLSIGIHFRKAAPAPQPEQCNGTWGENVALRIFETWEKKIDANSSSTLALKLSSTHDIYVVLHEQGADATRRTTAQKLAPVLSELKRVADLPDDYLTAEIYGPFFRLLFKPPFKVNDLGRYPGLQDRDTFYGYFKALPGMNYEGINIKISHPVYCAGEGTAEHERLQKAEYLGRPHHEGDLMFFLIEDNGVYLAKEYNKMFGTFSGTLSFDGTMEVLNVEGRVLLKTTKKFKGWER